MGWSIGWCSNWRRDIGYGVPSQCDHPKCKKRIHRGVAYVCGGVHGDDGCGLHFCSKHLLYADNKDSPVCERCAADKEAFKPKPDLPVWVRHKLRDKTWQQWRDENPKEVAEMKRSLEAA